jgi:hypothetical protein
VRHLSATLFMLVSRRWWSPSRTVLDDLRALPRTPTPPSTSVPILILPKLLLSLPQQILHRKIQTRLNPTPAHNLAIDIDFPRPLVALVVADEEDAVLRGRAPRAERGGDVVGARAAGEGGAVGEFRVCCVVTPVSVMGRLGFGVGVGEMDDVGEMTSGGRTYNH